MRKPADRDVAAVDRTDPDDGLFDPACEAIVTLRQTADELLAARGAFFDEFGVAVDQSEQPSVFEHFYMVADQAGDHDGYLPDGTIIRGRLWDAMASPNFDVVLGYSHCEDTCYVDYGALTYLGPDWKTAYDSVPEAVAETWSTDQRSEYSGAAWIDRRADFIFSDSLAFVPPFDLL